MDYIIEKNGRKREALRVRCDHCEIEFLKRATNIPITKHNFCSRKCYGLSQHDRIEKECTYCHAKIWVIPTRVEKSKSGLFYCSRSCKANVQCLSSGISAAWPPHYGTTTSYRQIALNAYPHECEVCKYNEYIALLQVHHIDSDRSNSKLDNLIVLCPTCHWGITLGFASMGINRKWIKLYNA